VYGLCGFYNYRQDDDLKTISGLPELNPYSFVKKICNAECDVKEPANEIIIDSEVSGRYFKKIRKYFQKIGDLLKKIWYPRIYNDIFKVIFSTC